LTLILLSGLTIHKVHTNMIKEEPRVLIGCVTHDKHEACIDSFLDAIRAQDYPNSDLLFVETSGNKDYAAKLRGFGAIVIESDPDLEHPIQKVTEGRRLIQERAVEKGYDLIWFVDSDIIPESNALSALVSHRKHIISGVCLVAMNMNGTSKPMPNIYSYNEEEECMKPINLEQIEANPVEISSSGFGCVLISKDVFKDIRIRYLEECMAGEDMAFFADAKEKGFRAYADTSIRCDHLVFPPGDPRNRRFVLTTQSPK